MSCTHANALIWQRMQDQIFVDASGVEHITGTIETAFCWRCFVNMFRITNAARGASQLAARD